MRSSAIGAKERAELVIIDIDRQIENRIDSTIGSEGGWSTIQDWWEPRPRQRVTTQNTRVSALFLGLMELVWNQIDLAYKERAQALPARTSTANPSELRNFSRWLATGSSRLVKTATPAFLSPPTTGKNRQSSVETTVEMILAVFYPRIALVDSAFLGWEKEGPRLVTFLKEDQKQAYFEVFSVESKITDVLEQFEKHDMDFRIRVLAGENPERDKLALARQGYRRVYPHHARST